MGISIIDLGIFIFYLIAMLGIGFYFYNKNKSEEDYYVGGRNMSAGHIGLSVVATDVGGGFSVGLGGLGFLIGISGSWLLFTGLIGAWLSAYFLIPKIYPIAKKHNFLTFPEMLQYYYNSRVALIASFISLIGYIGFTSSQILAGAKLASATFPSIDILQATLIMGIIAVVYTVVGGIKAVIYTDTVQWIILMVGLIGIGIPFAYFHIGGFEGIKETVPNDFLSLGNIKLVTFFNWLITIIPIWFIGMTLYQRIYAAKDLKTAKKAWKIAGLFEYPIMAFMGVILGMFASVAFNQGMFEYIGYGPDQGIDSELGLPLLLRTVLPVGFMGLMMSAYFSAIMSTADSCLMAASGNLSTDIFGYFNIKSSVKKSQILTLIIGTIAIVLASSMTNVLELMLHSYSFMVSGLFIPVVAVLTSKKVSSKAAFWSMIVGGTITLSLIIFFADTLPFGLDPNFYGISASAIAYYSILKLDKNV
jgi:solute:Na+ symporter, SSS family